MGSSVAAVTAVGNGSSRVAAPLQCVGVGVVAPPDPVSAVSARLCGSSLETAGQVARPNAALAAARAASTNLAASPWGSVEAGQSAEAAAQVAAIAGAAATAGGVYDVWAWVAVSPAALTGVVVAGGNGTVHPACTAAGLAANASAALPLEMGVVNASHRSSQRSCQ